MDDRLTDAIAELREEEAEKELSARIDAGADPLELLAACQAGMTRVGERFENGQYFLSELIYSGVIFQKLASRLEEITDKNQASDAKGKVLVGTVKGDVHDLGKNIVVMLLRAHGFEVVDLGVDIPGETFLEKVKQEQPQVLGLSALITTSLPEMKRVVDLIAEAGLREKTAVMIGGGVTDENCRKMVGADLQSRDAYRAVRFCEGVSSGKDAADS